MATSQAQYQNLGQFNFTTAPDQTGLNPGNMTSTFDTGQFKPSKLELYRLVVGVPSLPSSGNTPMVVQLAGDDINSLTTCTVTLPKATTKGNLVVVAVATWANTANPTVSGVTLGGSADNFASVVSETGGNDNMNTYIWADPDCGQSSATIVVTCTGGSGTGPIIQVLVWEVSGTLSTSSVSAATDVSASGYTSSSAASLVTTSATSTTQANDIVFGVAGLYEGGSDTLSLTLPNPEYYTAYQVSSGNYVYTNYGYTVLPAAGASVTCTASCTPDNGYFSQCLAAFLPAASSGGSSEIPFKVMIGNKTWDINQTVAGVGYTYDPQNAMYLNQGEQLAILWTDLPASVYSAYSQSFTVTGSFRYDPSLPNNNTY
jgi:hypothetical protein